MAEYISRAAAERAAHMAFVRGHDAMQYATMIHLIAKIPAADVRENTIRTQADRIRAMSDEELAAELMCPYNECPKFGVPCYRCTLDWLQSPAGEVEE